MTSVCRMTGLQGAPQGQEQTDLCGPLLPWKVWVGRSWGVGLGGVSLQGPRMNGEHVSVLRQLWAHGH